MYLKKERRACPRVLRACPRKKSSMNECIKKQRIEIGGNARVRVVEIGWMYGDCPGTMVYLGGWIIIYNLCSTAGGGAGVRQRSLAYLAISFSFFSNPHFS